MICFDSWDQVAPYIVSQWGAEQAGQDGLYRVRTQHGEFLVWEQLGTLAFGRDDETWDPGDLTNAELTLLLPASEREVREAIRDAFDLIDTPPES